MHLLPASSLPTVCVGVCVCTCGGGGGGQGGAVLTHLLLVLPLRVEPRLDALSGLLEGLSLGNLSRVVGADTHDVGAGENEDIGDKLQRERRKGHQSLEPQP